MWYNYPNMKEKPIFEQQNDAVFRSESNLSTPLTTGQRKAIEYADRVASGEEVEDVLNGLDPKGFMYGEVLRLVKEREIRSFPRSELLALVPIQHLDMADVCADSEESADVFIEFMRSQRTIFADEKRRAEETERFDKMISGYRKYVKLKQDALKQKEVRAELGIDSPTATEQIQSSVLIEKGTLISETLDSEELHRITGAVDGLYFNGQHGQDAFAVEDGEDSLCVVVCDGVSSRKSSGVVSSQLAKKIASSGVTYKLTDIISSKKLGESLLDITSEIQQKKVSIEGGGSSTLTSVRIDKKAETIEWSSVGDSPIFVVDTDSEGNVSWEIVTENKTINDSNYTNNDIVEDLKDPETHAVSVKESREVRSVDDKNIKHGSIKYKPGRKVVVASDFITKMLLHDPKVCFSRGEMWKNSITDDAGRVLSDETKRAREEIWKQVSERNKTKYPEFWAVDKKTGQSYLNPAFLLNLDAVRARKLLDDWMNDNSVAGDDATIMVIDLDKHINNVK